jgi:dipeptidyl aminopeptidase/acylaminoacyl peptidase
MLFRRNVGWRYAFAAVAAIFSLACHAQSTLTPAQVLNFRRIADLHFSPDGAKLAYVVLSYQWDWQPHLSILNVASGRSQEITPQGKSDRSPQWSPAGHGLAFISNRDGKPQVYVMATDESAAVAVTAVKYGVSRFHWAPDGKAIAYLAKSDDAPTSDTGPQVADLESDLPRLWVVDLASKATHRVGITRFRVSDFQWRNSSEILVVATDQPRVEEFTDAIYSVAIKDGAVKLISTPPHPFDNLIISPDGTQFAVRTTLARGPMPRDLVVGTVGRKELRKVAEPRDLAITGARWDHSSMMSVLAVDGFINRIRRLSPTAAPAPLELPLSVDSFDISAEGITAFAGSTFAQLPEIYLRARDGSVRQLTHLQQGSDGVHLLPAAIFKTKSFDGWEIESALMRPAARNPEERWPLVLLVHGGPSSNFSSSYTWDTAWAQLQRPLAKDSTGRTEMDAWDGPPTGSARLGAVIRPVEAPSGQPSFAL